MKPPISAAATPKAQASRIRIGERITSPKVQAKPVGDQSIVIFDSSEIVMSKPVEEQSPLKGSENVEYADTSSIQENQALHPETFLKTLTDLHSIVPVGEIPSFHVNEYSPSEMSMSDNFS